MFPTTLITCKTTDDDEMCLILSNKTNNSISLFYISLILIYGKEYRNILKWIQTVPFICTESVRKHMIKKSVILQIGRVKRRIMHLLYMHNSVCDFRKCNWLGPCRHCVQKSDTFFPPLITSVWASSSSPARGPVSNCTPPLRALP